MGNCRFIKAKTWVVLCLWTQILAKSHTFLFQMSQRFEKAVFESLELFPQLPHSSELSLFVTRWASGQASIHPTLWALVLVGGYEWTSKCTFCGLLSLWRFRLWIVYLIASVEQVNPWKIIGASTKFGHYCIGHGRGCILNAKWFNFIDNLHKVRSRNIRCFKSIAIFPSAWTHLGCVFCLHVHVRQTLK
jgi:hypothetical protein